MESEKSIFPAKNQCRSLLKKCFKNSFFSLVPFEIWRDFIVSNAGIRSITVLSQTCIAFKEIVNDIGEKNINLALLFRKEGQVVLAKKHLLLCANNNNNPIAMFHLGYAYHFGGWGLKRNDQSATEWYKKSSGLGCIAAMPHYASLLKFVEKGTNAETHWVWAEKAISSKNSLAVGCCIYYRLSKVFVKDTEMAACFEASAKEGDEYGQYYFGLCFELGYGLGKSAEKSFYWYLKSAEQGNFASQHLVAYFYANGEGCIKDQKLADVWFRKARTQPFQDVKLLVRIEDEEKIK